MSWMGDDGIKRVDIFQKKRKWEENDKIKDREKEVEI